MSLEQQSIRIAIGDNLWTRALVDGSVRVDGFAVEFHSKVTLPDRLHGVREGKWHGSDGTLTDYLLEKAGGLGVPKVALPIFMLGGFRQRTLLMRRDGVAVEKLKGRKVLLPRVLTPGAVYVRGLLADEFGIARETVEWHAIHGAEEDASWKWLEEPIRQAGRIRSGGRRRGNAQPRRVRCVDSSGRAWIFFFVRR